MSWDPYLDLESGVLRNRPGIGDRDDQLRGLARPDFVDAVAWLLSEINALHPFREGNGGTQRAFLGQLARAAGHGVRWAAMDPSGVRRGVPGRAPRRSNAAACDAGPARHAVITLRACGSPSW